MGEGGPAAWGPAGGLGRAGLGPGLPARASQCPGVWVRAQPVSANARPGCLLVLLVATQGWVQAGPQAS